MFIKIVVVLLLLIVAASLLTGRGQAGPHGAPPPVSRLRPLMLRVAVVLLAVSVMLVALHFLA